jgi:hypothetical protein
LDRRRIDRDNRPAAGGPAGELGGDWFTAFQVIERRLVWEARVAIIIVGATGLYMIAQADLWDRFRSADYWWMHAMVGVWTIFAISLFVVEPLFLDRRQIRWANERPDAALRTWQRCIGCCSP